MRKHSAMDNSKRRSFATHASFPLLLCLEFLVHDSHLQVVSCFGTTLGGFSTSTHGSTTTSQGMRQRYLLARKTLPIQERFFFLDASGVEPLYMSSTNNNYGRGSEIWPPTNQDEAIRLQDSFPAGNIPDVVIEQLTASGLSMDGSSSPSVEASKTPKTWLDRLPVPLLFTLVGWIRPLDVGLVVALSLYTAALNIASQSLRSPDGGSNGGSSSVAPTLPGLPPQGHVPHMVQNPMQDLTYSYGYDIWWRSGILLGFFLPILSIAYAVVTGTTSSSGSFDALTTLARPLFLLSCQAISELACKDWLLPLPIRIWIPISYQVVRLVYLGLTFVASLTTAGDAITPFLSWVQVLTGLNCVYTLANVFGFLLPVALMRYMRAHFFAVEAASVVLHEGMEETVGLSSTSSPASVLSDKLEGATARISSSDIDSSKKTQ